MVAWIDNWLPKDLRGETARNGAVACADFLDVKKAREKMDCFGRCFTHVQTCDYVRSCSKCYAMDCFGTYFTHVQTCDYVRVQSATQWTASVHALHMSKPVITFVFKVLRNGLLRYMLYTCPNL